MLVCEYCLQAIKSHGDPARPIIIVVDETDPEKSRCEWCKESGNNTLYEI